MVHEKKNDSKCPIANSTHSSDKEIMINTSGMSPCSMALKSKVILWFLTLSREATTGVKSLEGEDGEAATGSTESLRGFGILTTS